jgi:cellulose synthase/poly-beta-1,6-N-acetylglucosamine synthase-like glycosyltransferase
MEVLFWGSALFILYVYAGYPALLVAWTRVSRHTVRPAAANRPFPAVSIVVAARNEAARLPARIENLLSLDYPADRRQIIVVNDGSTDDTLGALARFEGSIDVLSIPPTGKAAALNAGVARARHDVLVFADARQTFSPGALLALTAPFAEPGVGGVTGELLLDFEAGGARRAGGERRRGSGSTRRADDRRTAGDRRHGGGSTIGEGVGMYWRYEKALRRMESAVGSTVGATGAIYALRRSLWRPLPDQTILDDVLAPMRAVLAGYRVVFAEDARAYDGATPDAAAESRRKVRTLAGNFQILWLEPRLLVPFVNPVWLQYVSHKIGRLAVPYALIALLAANIALAAQHVLYGLTLAGQCGFYLLAGYGAWLVERAAPRVDRAHARPSGRERHLWPTRRLERDKGAVNA